MSADVVRGLRRVTKISFPLDWGDKTEEKEAFSGAPKDGVPPKLVSRRKSAHGARAAKSEDPGTMTPGVAGVMGHMVLATGVSGTAVRQAESTPVDDWTGAHSPL